MNKRARVWPGTLCLIVLGLWVVSAQGRSGHVVLVTIDGFANFHLKNAQLDIPTVRALARAGVEAESSETVFPSVTHPSHTTLITGVTPRRHGVLSNRVTNRLTGERFHVTNKARRDIVRVPTLFDAVRAAGRGTAAFFWPETKDDPSIDFNVPEVFASENVADIEAVPDAVLAELRKAGIPIDDFFRYYDDPFLHGTSDFVLARAAAHAIRTHRPAFTAIHFLMTDVVQHEVGPAHYRSQAALSAADRSLGVVVDAVRDAGLADDTTFVVTADHGFATVDHQVNLAPLFADPVLKNRIALHPQGWTLFVELLPGFDMTRDGPALDRALARARQAAGVARVVPPSEFHALGLPTYDESPYIRGHYMVIADVDTHIVMQPANTSTARVPMESPRHEHGYLPTNPKMFPALVLSGKGIRRGAIIGHVRNLDVAPTIAHLLGLTLKDVEGRVLTEALAR